MRVLLVIGMLLIYTVVFADVYKWVDDKGQVHYTDKPTSDHSEKISVEDEGVAGSTAPPPKQPDTQKVIKDLEKSRKQREQARHKKHEMERRQEAKCLTERNRIRKLEARMRKNYREFSNDRSPAYARQAAELAERKKHLDKYCN
ncbi:MAG: DUF4124 domain-containing protein [Gammaproteobacteria bacterium]|nr:DUF4124 domain-containing protein [Gammaproteobacteria bacterium]